MFILLGLSIAYVLFGKIAWVAALFYGLKPAVVAIVILALIKIGKKSLLSIFHYVIAALSFVGIFFFDIPFPYLIIGAVVLGWLVKKIYPSLFKQKQAGAQKIDDESGYLLHSNSNIPGTGFSAKRLILQVALALLLWVAPFALFYTGSGQAFWQQLALFFTKAALVTFGGAYAVLPYVAQVTVEKFNWLSNLQMIDGLALGETTPGPLIMVLAFVGFMAGYNHFQNSVLMGSLGLFLTTYYTFLPCFLFILAGAPIIEKTQDNPQVKALLSIVTAAIVGVILNLTIYFALAVAAPQKTLTNLDYISLAWIVISFIAMYRFKIGMITWIGVSALAGLVHYLVTGYIL